MGRVKVIHNYLATFHLISYLLIFSCVESNNLNFRATCDKGLSAVSYIIAINIAGRWSAHSINHKLCLKSEHSWVINCNIIRHKLAQGGISKYSNGHLCACYSLNRCSIIGAVRVFKIYKGN